MGKSSSLNSLKEKYRFLLSPQGFYCLQFKNQLPKVVCVRDACSESLRHTHVSPKMFLGVLQMLRFGFFFGGGFFYFFFTFLLFKIYRVHFVREYDLIKLGEDCLAGRDGALGRYSPHESMETKMEQKQPERAIGFC